MDAVLDEVREHALEQQLVGAHGDRLGGRLELELGRERRIEPELLDQLGERDRRLLDLRQLAERAERIDEAAQALDLLLDDLARVGEQLLEPLVVALVARDRLLDRELDRRQRILDLVREPARDVLPRADALEVLDLPRVLEVVEHRVERAAELGHLVGAAQLDARIVMAVGDPARGRDEPCERRVTSVPPRSQSRSRRARRAP